LRSTGISVAQALVYTNIWVLLGLDMVLHMTRKTYQLVNEGYPSCINVVSIVSNIKLTLLQYYIFTEWLHSSSAQLLLHRLESLKCPLLLLVWFLHFTTVIYYIYSSCVKRMQMV